MFQVLVVEWNGILDGFRKSVIGEVYQSSTC